MAASVGTANSGVPMKTTRMRGNDLASRGIAPRPLPYSLRSCGRRGACPPSRRLLSLCLLLELAHDDVALEPRQEIDDQLAVEVVDFVLDGGCEQALCGQLLRLALTIKKRDGHGGRPLDLDAHLRDRQAPLLVA